MNIDDFEYEREKDAVYEGYQREITKGRLYGFGIITLTIIVFLVATGQWKYFFTDQ